MGLNVVRRNEQGLPKPILIHSVDFGRIVRGSHGDSGIHIFPLGTSEYLDRAEGFHAIIPSAWSYLHGNEAF